MYITQSLTRAMMLQGNHVIHRVFANVQWLVIICFRFQKFRTVITSL